MTTGIMTKTIIAKYFKTQPALKAWFFGSYSQSEQTKDKDVMFFVMLSDLEELLGGKMDLVSDDHYCHIYWNDAMSVYHKHRVIDNKDGVSRFSSDVIRRIIDFVILYNIHNITIINIIETIRIQ